MNENVNVCITPKGDKPVLHFSQFDNERVFTVTVLADDGESAAVLTGLDIEFRIRKTDSHVVTIAPESVADNVITFKTTEQMCACCGQNIASVVLMKDDMVIATLDILVDIQRDILSGGLTSESDIRNLTTQIEQIVPEVVGDDYYTKTEVDELIDDIPTFDPSNYYDKNYINTMYWTAQQIDQLFYRKTYIDDNYYTKDDVYTKSEVYNKTETDNLLADKADKSAISSLIVQKDVAKAPIASFNTDLAEDLTKCIVDINPVQDLHGYSKPWSGGDGKNKLDYLSNLRTLSSGLTISATNGGAIHYQGTATANYCQLAYMFNLSIPSGTTITVSRDVAVGHQHYFDFTFTDNSVEYVRIMPNTTSTTYTLPKDLKSIDIFCLDLAAGTAYNETVKFQLEYGSQATSWEPYSNICPISGFSALNVTLADGDMQTIDTKTVNFGQTVYGGVADVTNGKVESDFANDRLDAKTWSYNSSIVAFNATFSDKDQTRFTEIICSCYVNGGMVYSASEVASKPDKTFYTQNNSDTIFIKDSDYTDTTTWLNALGSNTICYPIATPIEIDTTPENLTAIVGQNNVYGDTNGDTTVRFTETIGNELGV